MYKIKHKLIYLSYYLDKLLLYYSNLYIDNISFYLNYPYLTRSLYIKSY